MISATGNGTGKAQLRMCNLSPPDGKLQLAAGHSVIINCGSLRMQVLTGPVEPEKPVELILNGGDIVVKAPTGSVILVTEFADEQIQVENLPESSGDVSVVVNGEETVLGPAESLQSVSIDVLPADAVNCINTRKQGVVPVAVFSSPDFDATQIDPLTCSLGGLDIATKGRWDKPLAHIEDVDLDGYDDLVLQFQNQTGVFQGQASATLRCELFADAGEEPVTISGYDSICLVP
jgi:hypothetical protein